MKSLIAVLLLSLTLTGCSPKGAAPTTQAANPAVPADLGKADDHFKALYGSPKTESRAAAYDFSLPGYGGMLRLSRPMLIQEYQQSRFGATVICVEDSRRAIWVRYFPLDPWTEDQLKAALAAYGSGWKRVQANSLNLLVPDLAPTTWLSANGTLAYKTLGNELFLYAPQLHADLRRQAEEVERQKKAVPKF